MKSKDGAAVLAVAAIDDGATGRAIRLVERLANCFRDAQWAEFVKRSVATLVGRRLFSIGSAMKASTIMMNHVDFVFGLARSTRFEQDVCMDAGGSQPARHRQERSTCRPPRERPSPRHPHQCRLPLSSLVTAAGRCRWGIIARIAGNRS